MPPASFWTRSEVNSVKVELFSVTISEEEAWLPTDLEGLGDGGFARIKRWNNRPWHQRHCVSRASVSF